MSVGGCSFVWPDTEAPIPVGTPLELTFYWCVDQRLIQLGILLRMQTQQEKMTGHVGFCAENRHSIREMGALITHIERVHLRTRHNESPDKMAHWAQLYQTSKRRHTRRRPCSKC